MKWGKIKKAAENLLADSLKGRVQYHITRYGPGYSHHMTRAWITLDKEILVDFTGLGWLNKFWQFRYEILQANQCLNPHDEAQREGYYAAGEQAKLILEQEGIYSRYGFTEALKAYLQTPIDEAIVSEMMIIRAIAMLDRRVGKRRLQQLQFSEAEHPLVIQFYKIRCEAEGIEIPS